MPTKINWCDETINPIQDIRKGKSGRGYHCTKCSPGCEHCYAERINKIRGNGLPFDDAPARFELIESELEKAKGWKKHRSIFVQSMGDLLHEAVPNEFIGRIYEEMANASHHTFLLLTKRPKRMIPFVWPDNVWPGLTICNQREWDDKCPVIMQIPGRIFLSIEPMLELVDLHLSGKQSDVIWRRLHGGGYERRFLAAVILGGESGPGARPLHPDWVRSVRDQCAATGVPFFFKQWGEWAPKSHGFIAKGRWGTITADGSWFENTTPWNGHDDDGSGEAVMVRIGKKNAGRLLDGRTHDDLPWNKSKV